MKRITLLTAGAALAAGIAIGWTARSSFDIKPPAEKPKPAQRGRQRIADVTTRVKTVTAVVTNTVYNTVTNTVRAEAGRPLGPGDFMAELERLKKEDPERYASMTNRMARFRTRMMQRAENKLETLASVDTSGWSRSQIENHEKYQDLIARHQELMELMRPDSGASREEREAAFSEMRELGRELRTAAINERKTLLDKTFSELGYSKGEARELRETVETIYSTTQEWGGHGRGGRGGRRSSR